MLLPPHTFPFSWLFFEEEVVTGDEGRHNEVQQCLLYRATHPDSTHTGPRTNSDPLTWTWVGNFFICYVRFPSGVRCSGTGTEMRNEAARTYRNTWKINHLLQNNSVKSQINPVAWVVFPGCPVTATSQDARHISMGWRWVSQKPMSEGTGCGGSGEHLMSQGSCHAYCSESWPYCPPHRGGGFNGGHDGC